MDSIVREGYLAPKIMILDDEPDIQAYLMVVLQDNGYQAFCVNENDSIINAVIDGKPDLIILDIMMPKRSGISIYKELRSSKTSEKIPVIIFSGITLETGALDEELRINIHEAFTTPPDGFIEKPLKLPVFLKLV